MTRRLSIAAGELFARAMRAIGPGGRRRMARSPLRRPLAAIILAGMVRSFEPGRSGGLRALVAWRVGGDPERRVRIADGRCARVRGRDRGEDPDATLALDHLALIELATGLAQGPQLYITGRLRVQGSIMTAQRLTSAFRIPGAGRG